MELYSNLLNCSKSVKKKIGGHIVTILFDFNSAWTHILVPISDKKDIMGFGGIYFVLEIWWKKWIPYQVSSLVFLVFLITNRLESIFF